jgi:iron complex outermembrane receptor protein
MIILIRKFVLFFITLILSCVILGLAFAAEQSNASDEIILEKVVVTPYRYEEVIHKSISVITIINYQQIKDSNSKTIPELLKSQTGVTVRDFYGNGTKTWVDLRGFGEQSQLNTLVLIDGRRVNEIDNSGVDWTQIPLGQVEKIEIVRGSTGSVLYGDNASGGVINIITKKGKGKPSWFVETQGGSYDMNKQSAALSGSYKGLGYYFNAGRESTHGYRKNSFYKATDLSTKIDSDLSSGLSFRFSSGFHDSSYGLPGELSGADLLTMSRRSSKYGDDHATDKDYYFSLGGTKKSEDTGNLDADFSFRRRETDTCWLVFFGGFGNPIYKSRIDTIGFTPKYILDKEILGHENNLITGFDFYRSDYMVDNYDYSDSLQSFTDINKISEGYYIQDEFAVLKQIYLLGGYRYEKATYEFDYNNISNSDPLDKDVSESKNAFNTGLVYKYKEDSSAFLNLSHSFRFPSTDEYSILWPSHSVNTELKPQSSDNYEIGVKHRFSEDLKCDLTFFRMNAEDELYYDYAAFSNKNYDKTIHEGVEAAFDAKTTKKIGIFGNYSYTKAFFHGGVYNNNLIPLVPRHKGSVGIKCLINDKITCNFLANFVGERYFINDQANVLSKLNGYATVDANISYKYKSLTAVFQVNNIIDKKYSEYGACNPTSGKKIYYPSPERNFSLKLSAKF